MQPDHPQLYAIVWFFTADIDMQGIIMIMIKDHVTQGVIMMIKAEKTVAAVGHFHTVNRDELHPGPDRPHLYAIVLFLKV